MGLFDRLKELTQPYQEYDDDAEDELASQPRPASRPTSRPAPRRKPEPEQASAYSEPRNRNAFDGFSNDFSDPTPIMSAQRNNKVVNIHATTQLQVVLVKPEHYESVSEIASHLREKRTVVMNLEKLESAPSRRLLDFLSGFTFALEGKIKKVAVSTYIITPYNVDIMGDLMDELENNGLYIFK